MSSNIDYASQVPHVLSESLPKYSDAMAEAQRFLFELFHQDPTLVEQMSNLMSNDADKKIQDDLRNLSMCVMLVKHHMQQVSDILDQFRCQLKERGLDISINLDPESGNRWLKIYEVLLLTLFHISQKFISIYIL
jgi:hypothetical protein